MDTRRFSTWPILLCLLGGLTMVGCGDDDDPPPTEDASTMDADTDSSVPGGAPTVNTTPANGDKGVKIDDPIVISFSEPMNTASVEGAYSSDSIPKDMISFVWSANNTVLTIDASEIMMYGDGGINGATFGYGFTIADTAEDAQGDNLAAPVTVSWDTARDITVTILGGTGIAENDEVGAATGTFFGNTADLNKLGQVQAGDGDNNEIYKAFVTMKLSPLPPAIVEVRSAVFKVEQNSADASAYTDLGDLMIQHIAPLTAAPMFTDYSGSPLAELLLSDDPTAGANEFRTADITDWVQKEVTDESANISLRIEFSPNGQDGDNTQETAVLQSRSITVNVLAE